MIFRDPSPQSVSIFFDLATLVASPAHKWGAVLLNRSTYEVIGRAAHDGTRWVLGDLDLTKVSTTPYATVASVDDGTTLTLTAGGSLTSGIMRLWDTSAGASLGDVDGTVAGDTLTVPDTTGMAAGDQVWRTGVSEVEIGTGEVELGAAATGRFVYGSGFATAAGVAKFMRLNTANTQVRVTCSNAVQGNVAGDMIVVGRSSGANVSYVGQGCQSPGTVKCVVVRDATSTYGTTIAAPESMSFFGGWIGGAAGSLLMSFTSYPTAQAGPSSSNVMTATPLELNTTGSSVVIKTIGLV